MGLLLGYSVIVHDSGMGRSGIHVLPIEYGKARLNVLPWAKIGVLRHGVERETRVFFM